MAAKYSEANEGSNAKCSGSYELQFDFMKDTENIDFIKGCKVMFILRGVSGSGKSTISCQLQTVYDTKYVCSADHFFMKQGEYQYNASQIKQAHAYCQNKASDYCLSGKNVVIIDNTNIKRWETDYYTKLAHKHGYIVIMLIPKYHGKIPLHVLAERNKHGVPEKIIAAKLEAFETITPYFFGWFLDEVSASELLRIGHEMLKQCSRKLNDFFIENVSDYFAQPPNLLHVTAQYLGRNSEIDRSLLSELYESVGCISTVRVSKIVCTKLTLAAMVDLPKASMPLYHNDGQDAILRSRPGYDNLPLGYAAHITLGCASGVQAKQAKHDVSLGRLLNTTEADEQIDNIKYYHSDKLCVVQLQQSKIFKVMFASAY